MSTSRKAGLVILAIGILLLVGSCTSMNRAYGLRSSGRELMGRVIDRDDSSKSLEVRYLIKGESYTRSFDVDAEFFRSHRKHSKVDLLYLPDDPDGAVLANDTSLSGSNTILFLLAALGFGAFGLVLAITQPGAGNIFERPKALPKREPNEESDEGDDDDSDEGPAFVGGRPI